MDEWMDNFIYAQKRGNSMGNTGWDFDNYTNLCNLCLSLTTDKYLQRVVNWDDQHIIVRRNTEYEMLWQPPFTKLHPESPG